MFEGGVSKSFSIFPIRVVYMPVEQGEAPASILISVSKRRFKRAVKRNRVKRQIREAYRKNKSLLVDELQRREQRLAVAFIYLSDELVATAELEEKMKIALARISEKLFSHYHAGDRLCHDLWNEQDPDSVHHNGNCRIRSIFQAEQLYLHACVRSEQRYGSHCCL